MNNNIGDGSDKKIIIFDSQCCLCSASVRFIIKREKQNIFLFSPLESAVASRLMQDHKLKTLDTDSIVLISGDKAYVRSEAVFEILKELKWLWPLLGLFRYFPKFLNDLLYDVIAKNRYKVFGKENCPMTSSLELDSRLLLDDR